MPALLVGLILILTLITVDLACAAPPQLLGKSITASWNVTRTRKDIDSAEIQNVAHADVLKIYISAQGRIFNQMVDRRVDGGRKGRRVFPMNTAERVADSGSLTDGNQRPLYELRSQ
jgi:hypothetical protein